MYECKCCDYLSSNKSDYTRHLSTRKHKYRTLTAINQDIEWYTCNCGKKYKVRNSLWYHKKKCKHVLEATSSTSEGQEHNNIKHNQLDVSSKPPIPNQDMDIVLKVLKDNEKLHELIMEQQKQLFELAKQPRTNINSNNRFNLQFFLNEQCKDAMTLQDFVNSLTVQLDDLEYTKTNGLAQGITEVFVNGLKQLDMYSRPIHCTDQKRTTMYIKESGEWEKDKENEKLKDSIITINKKHIVAIKAWEAQHPNWEKNDQMTDEYMKMVQSVTNSTQNTENIIIKQVAKEVIIDR
jgi:hypothetical protein